MVRTKADAALRVAAGAKAPKKMANRPNRPSASPSPTGKDNLPVNRYHPRETPNWQKKITCFYEKQVQEDLSEKDGIPEQSSHISHDGIPKQSSDISDDVRRKPKRTSSELDTTDDETSTNKSTFKRFKSNNNMEIDSEQAVISEETVENEALEMEE